jgi:hypothetical protein
MALLAPLSAVLAVLDDCGGTFYPVPTEQFNASLGITIITKW